MTSRPTLRRLPASAALSLTIKAALLLTFNVSAARAVLAGEAASFRLLAERLVIVPVRVNGEGPFDFLLDTGTTTTLVTTELAARLSLRAADRLTLVTAAGERAAPRVRLTRLALGGREARDVEALALELDAVRRLDGRVAGVLGQNFLRHFNYALDYARRQIEFDAGPCAWRGARVPFVTSEGKMIVPARPDAGPDFRLALDAGATALILFRRPEGLPASLGLGGPSGSARAVTEAGSRAATLARLAALRVGAERLSGLTVAFLPDADGGAPRAEDGLLPTSLFRAVYFNNAEGYVIFNPKRP
jgi:predicted aspartyl protease